MSSTLPPPPPPAGPPGGAGGPEYLDSGGGGSVPPARAGGGRSRRGLLIGGGVVGLTAAGLGAWATYGFLATGPQPAEALPADTLGYVSIDLDPAGGQKIEAVRTLNKFPAFDDAIGIDPDDDLREKLFEAVQEQGACPDLDYGEDLEPWLGDRAAVAAVDLGGEAPVPVVVLQVKDADAADAGLEQVKGCSGAGSSNGPEEGMGWAISGDWAVVTDTTAHAEQVLEAAEGASLADDEDFERWTGEAGDAGVLTMYAGPRVGDYLADRSNLPELPLAGLGADSCAATGEGATEGGWSAYTPLSDECGTPDPESPISEELEQTLRDFEGMAATVRFDDGAVELEAAGDASIGLPGGLTTGASADVVQSLPADTAAVFGVGFADGWFGDLVDHLAPYLGQEPDAILAELSEVTGLDLPEDAETLAGESAAVVLGSGFDPESFFSSPDGSDIPVALKIRGDPEEIEPVLEKLRAMAGPEVGVLDSDSEGTTIVVGPNADYRAEVLADGGLGDAEVFQDVVREADRAHAVLFLNVDELQKTVEEAIGGGDAELLENIEPIVGFAVTGWVDDEVTHAVVRLTTD